MKYSMTIPDCPPSLNVALRMHWSARQRLKNAWLYWVKANSPEVYLRPIVRMRVTITLHHSRLFDRDNAYGSVKPIVDALKHHGMIHDDSPEWADLHVEQQKAKRKHPQTVIELEAA